MIGANSTISTKRMIKDTASKEAFDTTFILTGEPAYIEPVDAAVATILDSQNAFYTFKIFLEGKLDVKIGDKVIDQSAREYIVKGLEPYSNNVDTGDMTVLFAVSRFPA